MKLKFWKKEEEEKPEPNTIEIPEEHVETVLKLFSDYEQEWDNYYLKFKDIIIEIPEFKASEVVNHSLRHKEYLMWNEIAKLFDGIKYASCSYKLKFKDTIFNPYFEEII